MPSKQVICEHPRIILNPLASELISRFGNYTLRGHKNIIYKSKRLLYDFKTKNLSPLKLGISSDDVDTCYVTDFAGERYPLYLEVPCGNCSVCKESKVNAFVQRCQFETLMYDSNPLFLTLTYDEEHKKSDGLSIRDVQLFFKRLRINMYRHGFRTRLRYACVGEYGRQTKRPHYHAILWNCGYKDFRSYQEFGDILKKSWSNGFQMHRQVDPSDDKAFYYTSKYLRKGCDVPDGCQQPFLVCSNRGGSIGSRFIDLISDTVVKQLDTHLKYVNKFNSRVSDVQMSRYFLNRVLPSLSRSLPYSVKRHVRTFLLNYQLLKDRSDCNVHLFDDKFRQVVEFFSPIFYCPVLVTSDIRVSQHLPTNLLLRQMLESEDAIDRAMFKGKNFFRRAIELDSKRKRFLTLLFANVDPVDIINRAYNINRINGVVSPYEVF